MATLGKLTLQVLSLASVVVATVTPAALLYVLNDIHKSRDEPDGCVLDVAPTPLQADTTTYESIYFHEVTGSNSAARGDGSRWFSVRSQPFVAIVQEGVVVSYQL